MPCIVRSCGGGGGDGGGDDRQEVGDSVVRDHGYEKNMHLAFTSHHSQAG